MQDKKLIEWAENKNIASNPWLVYLSLTNRCNSKCSFCAYPKVMRKEKGIMCLDLVKKIVKELPSSVKKIYLQKQGEPFLHPDIDKIVKLIKSERPDIYLALHTNGIIATKDKIEKVLPYLDSMGISISSIEKDSYADIHGHKNFDKVINNIRDISGYLKKIGSSKPHVFIDYVIQNKNHHQSEKEVLEYFRQNANGLASVDFHWLYNFQGEIDEGNLTIYDEIEEKKFPCCVFPWSSFTICYDGQVSYCFVEPRENNFMGNFTNESFDEIWNNRKYQNFRKQMSEKKFSELLNQKYYCKKCSWLWSMKSQSPKNLNGGYAGKDKKHISKVFGDLLELPINEIEEIADNEFNNGEITRALGLYNYIKINSDTEEIKEKIDNCKLILNKFRHNKEWKDKIYSSEIKRTDRECRYYPLGGYNNEY